jgi:hypothetical protein
MCLSQAAVIIRLAPSTSWLGSEASDRAQEENHQQQQSQLYEFIISCRRFNAPSRPSLATKQ